MSNLSCAFCGRHRSHPEGRQTRDTPRRRRSILWRSGSLQKKGRNRRKPRVPDFFFRHHTSNYSTSTLPTGGGVSNTVPSPKRHTEFYIKPNTGRWKAVPPCDIQNQTQGTVESRPPLLYKAEHRGRYKTFPPLCICLLYTSPSPRD